MQVTSLDYSSFVGRHWSLIFKLAKPNMPIESQKTELFKKSRIKELLLFEGMNKIKVDEVPCRRNIRNSRY